jgi:integrase
MLTTQLIRALTPRERSRKLFDRDGLYLLVQPSGSRLWRFRYRFGGLEKLISLGRYPEVSLKQARAKRDQARRQVASGVNPSAQRQATKQSRANTFEEIAREFLREHSKLVGHRTMAKANWLLPTFLSPEIGSRPIAEVEPPELLAALRKIEARGLTDTVQRTKILAGQIFRYAIATGRAKRDITHDLRGAVITRPARHRAALVDPKEVGLLLRALDAYQGQPSTRYALRLLPYVFLRSAELRGAEWAEIDFDAAMWRVPASRMKLREAHVVPLAPQSLQLLRELQQFTGSGPYLFPGLVPGKVISENTLNQGLMRLGYSSDQQTPHGFRTIASTMLNELGWSPDLIELQLAHVDRDSVRSAYNRAQRLSDRRKLMQAWADHLDALKNGTSNVVSLHRTKSA